MSMDHESPTPTLIGDPSARWPLVPMAMSLLLLLLGACVVAAPMGLIVDRFLPDDAFYFFKPAQNIATLGFSSFDGIHPTNGYQPLWLLTCVPVFWFFPEGGEVPVRLLLLLQLAFGTIGSLYLLRGLKACFGSMPTWIGILLWVTTFYQFSTNGLSTPLLVLVYGFTFDRYVRGFVCEQKEIPPAHYSVLAVGLSLCFLSRLDMAFLVAGLSASIVLTRRLDLPRLLAYVLPLALICGSYLLWNLISTGHLMPVSGAAKQFHSSFGWDAAVERLGGKPAALWENLTWTFRTKNRPLSFGLLAPWVLMALGRIFRQSQALSRFTKLWPFCLGTTISFFFYGISFYGGFSQTNWYYLPLAFVAVLSLCTLIAFLDELRPGLGWLPGLFVLVRLLGFPRLHGIDFWIPVAISLLVIAFSPQLSRLLARLPGGSRGFGAFVCVVVLLPFAFGAGAATAFLFGAGLVLALATIKSGGAQGTHMPSVVGVALLMALAPPIFQNRRNATQTPPRYWNYQLYQGALWAKANLPEDATIWSGSTGVLGYFSERTCVNTDGLINSFEFLENVLKKGKLGDFIRKWDYSIDAMPDEDLLKYYPNGEFLDLGSRYDLPAFPDGSLQRKLRVFKMNKD
jgi:hypothetical protein